MMTHPLAIPTFALVAGLLLAAAILWGGWSQMRLNYTTKTNAINTQLAVAKSTITLLTSEREAALEARDKMRTERDTAQQQAAADKAAAMECRLRAERAEHAYEASLTALGHQDRTTVDRVAALERSNRWPAVPS